MKVSGSLWSMKPFEKIKSQRSRKSGKRLSWSDEKDYRHQVMGLNKTCLSCTDLSVVSHSANSWSFTLESSGIVYFLKVPLVTSFKVQKFDSVIKLRILCLDILSNNKARKTVCFILERVRTEVWFQGTKNMPGNF